MNYYLNHADEVLKSVGAGAEGLSAGEAAARLAQNGKNRLAEAKKISILRRFFIQLSDPMTLILLAAAVIAGVTAAYSGEHFTDVFIILFVVVVNSILGVYQENKAEKAIEALHEMTAATSKVLRGGVIQEIRSEELVVGDVILLEAGDAVPADARIIESASMKIEEAALTGESVPVNKIIGALTLGGSKTVPLGDRKNMAYMGSTVVYGRGRAVVVATGMDTEMGKIADVLAKTEEGDTPLQRKLADLSKILSFAVIGICLFIFLVAILRSDSITGEVILNTFMIAVSLAVAAIPEGLATVVTIVLSIGVTNMSKQNAVIRKLTAVETLGCAQVVCSDKTGTLTQNKMTVVDHFGHDEAFLAKTVALSNDARLEADGKVSGEPTEAALVSYAQSLSLDKNVLSGRYPRIGEAPFDSGRKMMSTVHNGPEGVIQFTKGAPDEILKRCTKILTASGVEALTDSHRQEIMTANKGMADRALRVLAGAYRVYDSAPSGFEPETLERDLIFAGLTGMVDPVRPEVKDAIERCRLAGIRPIMITGDHRDTAVAIARELGIISGESEAITGAQLDEISDKDFLAVVKRYSVYARVQPEHKVRIVKAWKENGFIVAMTGDGVNDAPSIKTADIGIGMGITGTDVTKNVADMVLADDNFATIVTAVEQGRRIYDNIRKSIQFLLASNLSEVLAVFAATMMGFIILKPIHLLWINLITDSFPALALGVERGESDLMTRRPRNPRDGIFAGGLGVDVLVQGTIVAALTVAAYFTGHYVESGAWEISESGNGMTMAFLTLSMIEIFHSFNMRSQRGSLFKIKGHNRYLFGAMLMSLILTTVIIYVPALAEAFSFTHISLAEYALAMGFAFSIIPIVEIIKLFQRRAAR